MEVCGEPSFLRTLYFIKIAIGLVKIVVPLLIIIFGSIDLFKVVMNGESDKFKESTMMLVKRLVAGFVIFILPTLITFFINYICKGMGPDELTFADCIKNADKKKIEEIENNQTCYYCTSSNVFIWSYKEPYKDCSAGWKTDGARDKKACNAEYKVEFIPGENKPGENNSGDDGEAPPANVNYGYDGQPGNVYDSFDNNHFHYEYVLQSKSMLGYGLYTPKNVDKNAKLPLVVWLHGSGTKNSSAKNFKNVNAMKAFSSWELADVNAYILCPHLLNGMWTKDKVDNVVNYIIDNYNIDTSRIIIGGHSLGAMGTESIIWEEPQKYSAAVIVAGYYADNNFPLRTEEDKASFKNSLRQVPGRAYTCSLDRGSSFARNVTDVYSPDNIITMDGCGHTESAYLSFQLDRNGDGKSDLFEWALSQRRR